MKNNKFSLLLAIIGFLYFFISVLPHISLPFYWDTAAFLVPAAKLTATSGDILNYTTDMTDYPHTFLLQTILSIFFLLFTDPIIPIHIFSVIVSTILLLSLFFITKKVYPKKSILAGSMVLLLATNPLFIAQTNLVYFEIIALLLKLFAVYSLFRNNSKYFFLFGLLAFATRFENGVILAITGILFYLFEKRKKQQTILYSSVGLLVSTGFWLLVHKMKTGWFFYSPKRFFEEAPLETVLEAIKYIFFWQGRFLPTLLIVVLISFSITKNHKKLKNKLFTAVKSHKFVSLLTLSTLPIFIILYKLGYFLPRYILPMFIPFYFALLILLQKQKKIIVIGVVLLVGFAQILGSKNCYSGNFEDCSLVTNFIGTKKHMTTELTTTYQNSSIYSWHESHNVLKEPYLGYVETPLDVNTSPTQETEVVFVTPTSSSQVYNYAITNNFKLVKKKEFYSTNTCLNYTFSFDNCTKNSHKTFLIFEK